MSRLEISDLRVDVTATGDAVVEDVTLSIDSGEVVGVAGESGSGKTMTALATMGLLPPGLRAHGSVQFGGRELLGLKPRKWKALRGAQIAMIFQDPMTALHPMLSVEVQLTEHLRTHQGLSKRAARERAMTLLEQVRLPDPERILDAFPHQFSGGMRQRIAIAIALACQPQLVIADEPTTALDVTVQAGILALLDELRRETGMGMLFITHDLGVMAAIADRLAIMYAGRIVETGPTQSLLHHPRHPYTRSLIDALPEPDLRGRALIPVPGEPPSPSSRPPGCAFAPRCPHARPSCEAAPPPLEPILDSDGGPRASACPVDPYARGGAHAGDVDDIAARGA